MIDVPTAAALRHGGPSAFAGAAQGATVGRCRLSVSKLELKARRVSALKTEM
jgi:hypothetical protein